MNIKEKLETKSRSYWELMIDEWIFDELDWHLLKRRLLDNITYERLAEEVNLSTVRTKNRIYKAEKRLFDKL